jgi:hypothetical protein
MGNYFLSTSQIISFASPGFKYRLVVSNATNNTTASGWAYNGNTTVSTGKWFTQGIALDANQNGEIEVSEALQATYMEVSGSISDYSGLEYFTNVRYLGVALNPLMTSFHYPTLTQLELLNIRNNNITSIDLSIYPNLTDFHCCNNGMTQLNLSDNPELRLLRCLDNQLTSLDLSNNPHLIYLTIRNNNIQHLNVKNGAIQSFTGNFTVNATSWANNPLSYICCDPEELLIIQNHLIGCGYNLNSIVFDTSNNCVLSNATFEKKALLVAPNPSKGIFELQLPQATRAKVQVFSLLGQMVYETKTHEWSKLQLNLTNQSSGVYLLKVITDYGLIYQEKLVVN